MGMKNLMLETLVPEQQLLELKAMGCSCNKPWRLYNNNQEMLLESIL